VSGPALLEARGVSVAFGGVRALDDVSLTVPHGSIVGLIGPNGAGKTTLFAVLSGLLRPRAGQVLLEGRDVTRASPQARARLGLARTFQRLELFDELTVRQHLVVADRAKQGRLRLAADLLGLAHGTSVNGERELDAILELLGIDGLANRLVRSLPLGTSRLVEVARAVASRPRLLLLDEPSSGLDGREAEQLAEALARLRREREISLVVVEHNVEFVLTLADEVTVLDFGRVIATGTPVEVRSDPKVQAAYLGTPQPLKSRAVAKVGPPAAERRKSPLLEVERLKVAYGEAVAVDAASFNVEDGQVIALLGANGAGKSSLAAAIAGAVRPVSGRVMFGGADVTRQPSHRRSRAGLTYVPEGRGLFPNLSVTDNLRAMLRWSLPREERPEALARALSTFPVLAERGRQAAGTLSGGEQRMLMLARVIATAPRLVIADELSLGLGPQAVDAVFEAVQRLHREGVAVLLVEQYVERALELADAAVIMRRGHIVWRGSAADAHAQVLAGYLGADDDRTTSQLAGS
jgi:branched-chain amino acid transport system ATP-binding protein